MWQLDNRADQAVRLTPTVDNDHWDGRFNLPGVNGEVFAFVQDGQGNLYVGGIFTIAAEVKANAIVRWDGTAWHPLGEGLDGDVYALALDGQGNLYAGGYFTTAGVSANYIALGALPGTRWGRVGWLRCLWRWTGRATCTPGCFTTAGGQCQQYRRWDGTAWHRLGMV
jgi:hypothetical protein